jgi:hypothetical protein
MLLTFILAVAFMLYKAIFKSDAAVPTHPPPPCGDRPLIDETWKSAVLYMLYPFIYSGAVAPARNGLGFPEMNDSPS